MGKSLLGAGGLLAAIAACTCCVLPLSLTALGLGGAWLSTLNAVAAYELFFRIAAIGLLATGFWLVYAPARPALQANACPAAPSQRITKVLLWTGAAVMATVLLARWWMPMTSMA